MNSDVIEVVRYVNSKYNDVRVGVVAEAFGLELYWDEIKNLKLDHLDISVDGMKNGHDKQRNREGAFDLTIKMMRKIVDGPLKNKNFKKVAILSTLTTLNRDELLPMFKFFNTDFGLKNFFITPVSIFNNRPDVSLKLKHKEVFDFVLEVEKEYSKLDNAYVAFNNYEDDFGFWLKKNAREFYDRFKANADYFELGSKKGNSEFHFFWYPAAINPCREFIMNTNGDIFTGYVQAYGKIPKANIFGNVMKIKGNREEFFEEIINAPAFDFFLEQLKKIRALA